MIISGNLISSNEAYWGGGLYCSGNPVITDNILIDNKADKAPFFETGSKGGGICCVGGSPLIANNTIFRNSANSGSSNTAYGGGIYTDETSEPTIASCIVSGNMLSPSNPGYPGEGGGIYNANSSTPVYISCSDFWNNDKENFGGNVSDTAGINNNIVMDPFFCNPDIGEVGLRSDSPCLPENHPDGPSCGLIGAEGLACYAEIPIVFIIDDVLNDQGRLVNVQWHRSDLDKDDSPEPILGYELYRRIDDLPYGAFEVYRDPSDNGSARGLEQYPPGDWHYLLTVPAHGEDLYGVAAPTLEDSCVYNPTDYFSSFFVRATTEYPLTYYDSPVDSGYSVDNLSPNAPEGLAAQYNHNGGTALSWEKNGDSDFDYFIIYRGIGEDFTPSPGNIVETTVETSWLDSVDDAWQYSYKVSTVDLNGNESEPIKPAVITGSEIDDTPLAIALYQNTPNPFNPITTITFDIPRAMDVTLEVFSVDGKLVSTLADSPMNPGRKQIDWNGTDRFGRKVASGIYFYRLKTEELVLSRKMVLLR
jgi:hypothetical protein